MLVQLIFTFGITVAALAAPAAESANDSEGKIWAVLVAGSKKYDNYRHQADICHAYQIFHRHGIPDSNIIVMMYDDIAYNKENPMKGKIRNHINGPNVYEGVLKDYTGELVTPQHFLNILTGNKKAMLGKGSGKVLESGPNDDVFVYFADHGATALLGFPDDVLYADNLIKAFKTMHKKKMYKKLVFYLEACESGSMFDTFLPNDLNIYAVTSANTTESSYPCYNDKALGAYLGDEFSVTWMENVDSEEKHNTLSAETLLAQFDIAKERVKHSHPQMYGDTSLENDKLTDFVGNSNASRMLGSEDSTSSNSFLDSVSSRDVALSTLEMRIETSDDNDKKAELIKKRNTLIEGRKTVDGIFSRTLENMNGVDQKTVVDSRLPLTLEVMPCYQTVVDYFTRNCVNINKNTYALAHLYKFANLCAKNVPANDVIKVLTEECTEEHRSMSGIN